MGRKSHRPDAFHRRQVEAMAGYGVPEADIARVVGIDPKSLRKHYRGKLDTGHIKATAKVAEFLFRKATTDGSQAVTAAIFWLKTRGGWRETPQDHRVDVRDVRYLSNAELEQIILDEYPSLREEHSRQRAATAEPRHQRPAGGGLVRHFNDTELKRIIFDQQQETGSRPALPRLRS
jgi:hypothetical protein